MRGPRSLFARLLMVAVPATLAALLFAGFAIGGILERFVMGGLDDRLDAQIAVLARAVRADGTLDPARAISLPRFDEPGSGWQWQVRGPGGRLWRSGGDPAPLAIPPGDGLRPHGTGAGRPGDEPDVDGPGHEGADIGRPDWRGPDAGGPVPGEGADGRGRRVHLRRLAVASAAGPLLITAAGPRRIVEAPLRQAMVPLWLSLLLLGAGLGAATLVQLRVGLRPLRTIRASLADVRAGRRRRVPDDQPAELRPLADELNALLAQNEAGLAHARRHVSNLAHGLKTPLAALGVKLAEPGRDPDGALAAMLARIDRQVRHHLGRARAAAPGGTGRARAMLAPAVADLVAVLDRIHVERGVVARISVDAALSVAVDPQDLDEMLGNLLDNGFRHARAVVAIAAGAGDAAVAIVIDDDGPGLDAAALAEAMIPGRRLDEAGDGHGFGLSIARELAELNGGTLALSASPALAGLRVELSLPA